MSRELQVGVKAIIQDSEGRVLLLKRTEPYEEESFCRWDIPGGRIEAGEKLSDALTREIKEETGMDLRSIKQIYYAQDILRVPERHVVRLTYLVEAAGEPELSKEHNDYGWFTKESLPIEHIDNYFIEALKANNWI